MAKTRPDETRKPPLFNNVLGRMLRLYAAHTDQSLRDLAPQIGVSVATLSRVGRGGDCDVDTFLKIIHWMRVNS